MCERGYFDVDQLRVCEPMFGRHPIDRVFDEQGGAIEQFLLLGEE